jgi:transcriptional regulator with XRE-family HTH domain
MNISGNTIGERLRSIREYHCVSQHQIMKILGRPKSGQSWYSRVENGERRINTTELQKLADFYRVPIASLTP